MPAELLSVAEAGRVFLEKSGHLFSRLEKAELDAAKNEWVLTFQVGLASQQIKKVSVDGDTGKVVAFE